MTVKQLKKELATIPEDYLVILSADEEGNGYMPLRELNVANYKNGEIGLSELTEELRNSGLSEEDVLDGSPAIVLFP